MGENVPRVEHVRGYPVLVRPFRLAGRELTIVGLANFDALIDTPETRARFEHDEYLPYWAEFWPAARLLAERVAAWPEPPPGTAAPRVLEIGCGLGLVGLAALLRGYNVTISDYDADALEFVTESARRSGLPAPRTQIVDWRGTYPELTSDRILAAEVLYEARSIRPVADFLARHLRPGGYALLVDACRRPADAFPAAAEAAGLMVEIEPAPPDRASDGRPLRARFFTVRPRSG
jgi:SAM-dependent methyltransferase